MADIVKRLRQGIKASKFNDWDFERTEADMEEGADEIERLREALRMFACACADEHLCSVPDNCRNYLARAARERK